MDGNGWGAARKVLVALALASPGGALLSAPAYGGDLFAPDSVALTGGYSSNVAIYGAALNWKLSAFDAKLARHSLSSFLTAQVAYWHGAEGPTPYGLLWDTSLTPMLRWTGPAVQTGHFFAEGGIGVHLLSATRINNHRTFSTLFQFGSLGGAGFTFGPAEEYELGIYVEHISNANIKKPNDGITYPGLVLRVRLR